MKQHCNIVNFDATDYLCAWNVQKSIATAVAEGVSSNMLLLLEHFHVYTLGRRGKREEVLLSDKELARLGIDLYEVDRGGEVTYHGPGQIVGYPIVNLRDWGGPLRYIRALEQVIINTLDDFKIHARSIEGFTGVWVGDEKIAAIGVKISKGVAYHGFAINVNTDLSYFNHIVPCGIADRGVTSMKTFLDSHVVMNLVRYSLAYHFGKEMGFKMEPFEEPALVIDDLLNN